MDKWVLIIIIGLLVFIAGCYFVCTMIHKGKIKFLHERKQQIKDEDRSNENSDQEKVGKKRTKKSNYEWENPVYRALQYIDENIECTPNELSISESIIENMCRQRFNKESVTIAAQVVLIYLGLIINDYDIGVIYDDSLNNKKAGVHYVENGKKRIDIVVSVKSDISQVVAAICHECTHAYLYSKELGLEVVKYNEILTDCTAIYLGMGQQIKQGYKTYKQYMGDSKTFTSKIGYLNEDEVDYVIDFRKKKLLDLEVQGLRTVFMQEDRAECEKKLKVLGELIDRNENVVNLIMDRKNASLSGHEYDCFIECLQYKDMRHYWNCKKELEGLFEKTESLKEIAEVNNKIEMLATEITERTVILSKFL